MSRRKQPRPRHLEAEEDEIGLIGVSDLRLSSCHSAVQLKKPPFHLDAASKDENWKEIPGNERILRRMMKENISLQSAEDNNRCSSVDPFSNHPNAKQPTRSHCNRDCPSDNEETKQGHGTERSRTEEEEELEDEEGEEDSKNKHEMEADVSLASQDATNQSNCFLPGPADMLFRQRLPPPFPAFPPLTGDSSGVKLSSIHSTDVAVAQFAENNIIPTDIAVLNVVLFNLQQQQLFQMHLLQQLQQQLVCATNGTTAPRPATTLLSSSPSRSLSGDLLTSPVTSSANGNRPNPATFTSGDVIAGGVDNGATTTTTGDATPSTGTREGPGVAALDDGRGSAGSAGSSSSLSSCSSVTPIDAMIGMSTRNIRLFPSDERRTDEGRTTLDGGSRPTPDNRASGFVGQSPRNCCRFCQKIFSSESALQIHIRSHTGERPFKCSVCGNRFSTKGNLNVHFRCHTDAYAPPLIHVDQKPFFFSREMPAVSNHGARLQGPSLEPQTTRTNTQTNEEDDDVAKVDEGQRSKVNPSRTPSRDSVVVDATTSLNSQTPRQTPTLSFPETPTIDLKSALRMSSPPHPPLPPPPLSLLSSMSSSFPSFPAPLFSSFSAVHRHHHHHHHLHHLHRPAIETLPGHMTGRPFGFDLDQNSGFQTNKSDPLEQFMEVQHSLEPPPVNCGEGKRPTDPNQCGICLRTLSCKSALQMHYRTHTGERPFRCKICGRAFTTKGNLKTHMGVHRAKPPVRMLHQCRVCHKQFTNALVLQQHVRMHTGGEAAPRQLAFPPSAAAMMLVPPPTAATMGYLPPPFTGYPFFHSRIAANPQPLLVGQLPGDDARSTCKDPLPNKEERIFTEEDEEEEEEERERAKGSASSSSSSSSPSSPQSFLLFPRGDRIGGDASVTQGSEHKDISRSAEQPVSEETKRDNNNSDDNEDSSSRDNESPGGGRGITTSAEVIPPLESSGHGEARDGRIGRFLYEDFEVQNRYSSALVAFDAEENCNPLQQMEKIIRRTENIVSLHSDHARAIIGGGGSEDVAASDILINDRRSSSSTTATTKSSCSPAANDGTLGCFGTALLSSAAYDVIGRRSSSFAPGVDLSPKSFESATGKPNTTCAVCYKTFACRSALDIHYRSHTKERPFRCRACGRAFSTKGNMKQHMMTHKGGAAGGVGAGGVGGNDSGSFGSDCSSLSNPAALGSCRPPQDSGSFRGNRETLSPTDDDDPAKPDFTQAKLPKMMTPPFEDRPARLGSTSPASSSTPVAAAGVTAASGRRTALRHLCSVCQKPFSSASALQIHMRTHTGDRPFVCSVCSKAFTTKGNLKVHMGTHAWSNGPSRRGRRMSVEGMATPAATPPSKTAAAAAAAVPQFPFCPPARIPSIHELYHFPFHGFHARFAAPKMNEIAVFPKINRTIQHFLPGSAAAAAAAAELMTGHLSTMLKPLAFPLSVAPPALPRPLESSAIKCRGGGGESAIGGEGGGGGMGWLADRMSPDSPPQRGNSGELDLSVKKPSIPQTSNATQSCV